MVNFIKVIKILLDYHAVFRGWQTNILCSFKKKFYHSGLWDLTLMTRFILNINDEQVFTAGDCNLKTFLNIMK